MTGQWEKYVEQAAEAGWESIRPTYWADAKDDGSHEAVPPWAEADEDDRESYRKIVRAELAVVGPLIERDTRERMVEAAGRALERDREPSASLRAVREDARQAMADGLIAAAEEQGRTEIAEWLKAIR